MDNDLKILLSASLDIQKSTLNINSQLAELSKKLNNIKLSVNIDGKSLETLTASFSKFGNEQMKINKIIDQTSKTSGEALGDLNARVKQIQESSDEYAKVTIKTFKNTQNLKSATIEYRDELGKLVKEEMAWTTAVSKNSVTGKPEKNKIFQTTGFTFVEDFAKEAKATEQSAQQMDDALRNIGKKRTQAELADIALRQQAAYTAKEAEVANAEKAEKAQEELAHKLLIYQMNSAASVESLTKKRGDNVDVSALSVYQSKIQQLTSETPNLVRQMQLLDAEFKKITVDSQRTGESARQSGSYIAQMLQRAAMQAIVFRNIYAAENFVVDTLKTGFVDIEQKMVGYVQTNEDYFTSITHLADGTRTIVPITERINESTRQLIKTTHDQGAAIDDVLESARLWGRLYKDNLIVQEMTRQSTKLSTIDLVSLADATKMMESTLAQYGVQIKNVNDAQVIGGRILDSWTSVAHATMAPARDLGAAFERTGKIAAEMGVSFDFMNGLISSGVRNTALSGEILGNMWKTVLGSMHTAKAVDELTRLGVATKEVVGGTEKWKAAQDVILDLAIRMTGSSEDFSLSLQKMSRGVMQYAKLAASLNVGDILKGEAASIKSTNSTTELLGLQMDTIARKASQVKTSLLGMFSGIGESGGSSAIKTILDDIDQFVIGLNRGMGVIAPLTLAVGGLALAYKFLYTPINAASVAQKTLTIAEEASIAAKAAQLVAVEAGAVAKTIETTATVVLTEANYALAASEATAAAGAAWMTAGISLIIPAVVAFVTWLGYQKKAEEDLAQKRQDSLAIQEKLMSQYDRQQTFVAKLVDTHNKLNKSYDDLAKSGKTDIETQDKQTKIRGDLKKVSEALTMTIGAEGARAVETAKWSVDAIHTQIQAIKDLSAIADTARLKILNDQKNDKATAISDKNKEILNKEIELSKQEKVANSPTNYNPTSRDNGDRQTAKDKVKKIKAELEVANGEQDQLSLDVADLNTKTAQIKLDQLNGSSPKDGDNQAQDDSNFDADMKAFTHSVNQHLVGYEDAKAQVIKLKEIKANFEKTMVDPDRIESIKDDIYKLEHPDKPPKPNPLAELGASDTKRDMGEFARLMSEIDDKITHSDDLLVGLSATSAKYREETAKQIPLLKAKQILLHEEAEMLRADDVQIKEKLKNTKLTTSEQNTLLNQLDKNENAIRKNGHEWFVLDKTMSDISNKNSLSLVNEAIDKSADSIKAFEDNIKRLKTEMSSLKTDPATKIKDQIELIKAYGDESTAITHSNKKLEALNATLNVNSDAYIKNTDQITKNKATLEQLVADQEAEKMKIATQAIDTIKKGIQTEIDAEKSLHDAKIKNIDDATNAAISAIDKIQQANADNKTLEKDQTDYQKLQNEINAYSLDTSNEGQSKVIDLKQQQATLKEKIDDEQTKTSNAIIKQSLQDQNKSTKDALDDQTKIKTDALQNQLNDDTHWLDLQTQLINGSTSGIQDDMKKLIDGLGSYAQQSIGVAETQISKIKTMMSQIGASSTQVGNLATPTNVAAPVTAVGGGSFSGSGDGTLTWQEKLAKAAKDDSYAASELARAKAVYDNDKANGDMVGADAAHKYADQLRSVNASLPKYITGGLNTKTGIAQLDGTASKPELVLNSFDTSNILKVVDFTRDIMSKIKIPDLSNIVPKMAGSGGNTFNANFGAINITGDAAGANSAINTIVNGLKRFGINTNQY